MQRGFSQGQVRRAGNESRGAPWRHRTGQGDQRPNDIGNVKEKTGSVSPRGAGGNLRAD